MELPREIPRRSGFAAGKNVDAPEINSYLRSSSQTRPSLCTSGVLRCIVMDHGGCRQTRSVGHPGQVVLCGWVTFLLTLR